MNWVAMAGIGFLVYCVLTGILKRLPIRRPLINHIILASGVVLTFIPFGSYSLATLVYGVTAELSITSVFLLVLILARHKLRWNGLSPPEKRLMAGVVIVLGSLLYPGVLGFRFHDFYADGYWGGHFGFFLIALLLVFAAYRMWRLAAIFTLAWIAWSFSLGNSSNLWDYVLDIWVFIWSLGVWIKYGFQKLRYRRAYPSPDSL